MAKCNVEDPKCFPVHARHLLPDFREFVSLLSAKAEELFEIAGPYKGEEIISHEHLDLDSVDWLRDLSANIARFWVALQHPGMCDLYPNIPIPLSFGNEISKDRMNAKCKTHCSRRLLALSEFFKPKSDFLNCDDRDAVLLATHDIKRLSDDLNRYLAPINTSKATASAEATPETTDLLNLHHWCDDFEAMVAEIRNGMKNLDDTDWLGNAPAESELPFPWERKSQQVVEHLSEFWRGYESARLERQQLPKSSTGYGLWSAVLNASSTAINKVSPPHEWSDSARQRLKTQPESARLRFLKLVQVILTDNAFPGLQASLRPLRIPDVDRYEAAEEHRVEPTETSGRAFIERGSTTIGETLDRSQSLGTDPKHRSREVSFWLAAVKNGRERLLKSLVHADEWARQAATPDADGNYAERIDSATDEVLAELDGENLESLFRDAVSAVDSRGRELLHRLATKWTEFRIAVGEADWNEKRLTTVDDAVASLDDAFSSVLTEFDGTIDLQILSGQPIQHALAEVDGTQSTELDSAPFSLPDFYPTTSDAKRFHVFGVRLRNFTQAAWDLVTQPNHEMRDDWLDGLKRNHLELNSLIQQGIESLLSPDIDNPPAWMLRLTRTVSIIREAAEHQRRPDDLPARLKWLDEAVAELSEACRLRLMRQKSISTVSDAGMRSIDLNALRNEWYAFTDRCEWLRTSVESLFEAGKSAAESIEHPAATVLEILSQRREPAVSECWNRTLDHYREARKLLESIRARLRYGRVELIDTTLALRKELSTRWKTVQDLWQLRFADDGIIDNAEGLRIWRNTGLKRVSRDLMGYESQGETVFDQAKQIPLPPETTSESPHSHAEHDTQPVTEAAESSASPENNNDISKTKGRKVEDVIKDAESHLTRSPWPGLKPLARLLKCSPSTLSKACQRSPMLAKLKSDHQSRSKSVSSRTVGVIVDGSVEASDPVDLDDLTLMLIRECRTDEERSRIHAMSRHELAAMAGIAFTDPETGKSRKSLNQ
jgi:hypothetical protein